MLRNSAPAVVAAEMAMASTRRSQSGRRFWVDAAVEYTLAKDWSSSRRARMPNPIAPRGSAMNAP